MSSTNPVISSLIGFQGLMNKIKWLYSRQIKVESGFNAILTPSVALILQLSKWWHKRETSWIVGPKPVGRNDILP